MKQDFELLLRAGKRQEVERLLLALNLSKLPRVEVLTYANIASRVNRFDLALRILNPYVRGTHGYSDASSEEKIEYANALRKFGAVEEAAAILERIDVKAVPQVHFYLALCNFAQWRYAEALPHLRAYIASLEPGSYKANVAQINYASALISTGDVHEADLLLCELFDSARKAESRVLCANALELRAQIQILYKENWKQALAYLSEARHWLGDDRQNIANLFVRKWEAVAETKLEKKLSPKLFEVRDDALALRHWETLRDCQYYFAEFSGDTTSLLNLYFGTPYESFRQKIRERNPALLIPDTYLFGAGNGPVLDLRTGESESASLNCGQMSHRLLVLLANDLYKPAPLLRIFSGLFPDEYSNPFTSPNRVHQLIRQLRMQLEETKLPLSVEQVDGSYKIVFQGAVRLCVSSSLPLDSNELKWLRLKVKLTQSTFTNKDAAQALDTSRASVQRLLEWAVKTGHAAALAGGRSAKYKLVS